LAPQETGHLEFRIDHQGGLEDLDGELIDDRSLLCVQQRADFTLRNGTDIGPLP